MWRSVWEDLAAPHLKAAEAALARGDKLSTDAAIRTALTILGLAYSGDGYYIYVPLPEHRRILPVQRRLCQQLREINGDRVEAGGSPPRRLSTDRQTDERMTTDATASIH
ncbi:MAG: hypothetical protein NZM11_09660, partial [Anaerolineales bacterium]|nr:hypothetical protein [Anaerolineales bacterium]